MRTRSLPRNLLPASTGLDNGIAMMKRMKKSDLCTDNNRQIR